VKTVILIEKGNVKTYKQIAKNVLPAPKINKNNCKIDWHQDIDHIYNKIRGLSPYPGAWTTILNNDALIEAKIFKSSKLEMKHNNEVGQVFASKKELKVAVKNGYIIIDEIQLPGKRKMNAQDLLNGFAFSSNSKLL
jgi:methionyl-tRNA formyltransferase